MKQSNYQNYLHTHFMYVDCWHELPQTLLGSSDAERSCVTSYIFHISGWFLSYSKNYSSILCNGPFLRLLMFIPTIQKKRKKAHFSDHLFNAFGFAHFKRSKYCVEGKLRECAALPRPGMHRINTSSANNACQYVSRGNSSEQTWLNLQQFCCKMRSSKDKGQAL